MFVGVWEEELCGQEEVREEETKYGPHSQRGIQSEPGAGSQSSGLPRCIADRAVRHLGERQQERRINKERTRQKEGRDFIIFFN